MNLIDISILLVVSLSVFIGIRKGFFNTLFSFLVLAVSLYISGHLTKSWGYLFGGSTFLQGAAFVLLFVISFFLLTMILKLLKFVGSVVVSGAADIIGGVFLGILRGIIICVVLIFCVLLLRLDKTDIVQNSLLAPKVIAPIKRILATPPNQLKERIEKEVKEITR
jgi:membrane protein required for colicin V production